MHQRRVGIIIFFIVLSLGLLTATRGMITWDEPENYYVGRIYLNVFWTRSLAPLRNPNALVLPQALPFRADTHWERYPPLAITLASFSSLVLAEWLHVTDVVSAHHVVVLAFAALAVCATYAIGFELTGSVFLASIAGLVLWGSPLFLGHSYVNIKDVPQMALFTLSLWLGMVAMKRSTGRAYLVAGVVWGLALATKFNAVFVPVILGIWFITQGKARAFARQIERFVIYGIVGVFTVCVFWPWIVINPFSHLRMIAQYIGEVGRGLPVLFGGARYFAGVDVPWWYAPSIIFLQTPPIVLILALIGTTTTLLHRINATMRARMVVFVWVIVVFGRYISPHMIIYNGARHVMEVLPAVALLAAFGVEWLLSIFARWTSARVAKMISIVMLVGVLIYPVVSLHPYEALYFNRFAGETKKVSETFDFDYWGFSVGELVAYANGLAKDKNAIIYVEWLNFPGQYFPDNTLRFVQSETEHADFVIIPNSRNFFDGAIAYWNTHGTLVYTAKRNGVAIGYLFATQK